jgi:hypothetical protein
LRLATKAIESLATHSSSPTYRQGSGLEGSTSFTKGNTNFPVLNHVDDGFVHVEVPRLPEQKRVQISWLFVAGKVKM